MREVIAVTKAIEALTEIHRLLKPVEEVVTTTEAHVLAPEVRTL